MQFAAGSVGSDSLGSILVDPGASNASALAPITVELNGMDLHPFTLIESLRIQDTLGQPVTAAFTLVQPLNVPVVGDRIRILYFSQLLFAGTVDHVTKISPDLSTFLYQLECLDWSQILFRRKIRRTFTSMTLEQIVDSILRTELAGEGITRGALGSSATLTLVDADAARVFDVLRDVAGAVGLTFYVDFDKSIQLPGPSATLNFILDETSGDMIEEETLGGSILEESEEGSLLLNQVSVLLDGTSIQIDRETYRNMQTIIVTGTPAAGVEPNISIITRRNEQQIAIRASIEGGTGIYEDMESITHPSSNDSTTLSLLADGYAKLRLAVSGTTRGVFRCQVRGYGFRAGQVASVNLPSFGIIGNFIIQRISIREEAGTLLFHDLELTTSSLQQRAYEAWIRIVKGSKVTVQLPGTVLTNLQTFTTPGSDTWTVPGGITIAEFTTIGSGGGGGAGDTSRLFIPSFGCSPSSYHHGGKGGNGGRATRLQEVIPGQVWDITVGTGGTNGTNGVTGSATCHTLVTPIAGSPGGVSSVALSTVISCQANSGDPGGNANLAQHGTDGAPGGGIGDGVSTGGGAAGGAGGNPPNTQPLSGQSGQVEVRW